MILVRYHFVLCIVKNIRWRRMILLEYELINHRMLSKLTALILLLVHIGKKSLKAFDSVKRCRRYYFWNALSSFISIWFWIHEIFNNEKLSIETEEYWICRGQISIEWTISTEHVDVNLDLCLDRIFCSSIC